MPERDSGGYEHRDVHPRAILWSAIGLGLMLVVIFVGIHFFQSALASRYEKQAIPRTDIPLPHLQTNAAADLAKLRAEAEAKLDSYGWVDRSAGVIRIPIERAITLTAERGLPARTDTNGGGK